MTNMSTMRSVAETLLTALQSSMVKEVCSKWCFESELKDLIDTVSDVGSVLCAVEANRELAVETQEWVQKLKDAVYNADDLFDEILTVAAQTKGRFHRNNKLPDKVRGFFSDNRMSSCVENIRNHLGNSCISHSNLGFEVDYQIIREGVGDIHSRINARNDVIVGRKDDMNAVIDLLFDTNLKDGVSFITIEGVRGLGKTALAQLVYRDQRVEDEFPLRLWVQFSNGDEGRLSANEILGKILEAAGRFYTEIDDLLNIELTEQLRGKKYLIVLDDVCGKDQEEWLALRKFLMFSVGGSRIIVTTCSTDTTRAIGNEHRYELKGLSKENSWRLLEMTTFGNGQKHVIHPELAEIFEMCEGFPPAIKELGSLISSHDISKLSLSEEHALATNDEADKTTNLIIPDNFETQLKSCLSYCALFPKDFIIDKKMLLDLWMAQGYVVPLDDGQSMVDAAEEYLSILLLRSLLQPVKWDEYGEVVSCKVHTLMHDVSLDVGAQEICVVDSIVDNVTNHVLHLHHIGNECSESSFPKSRIRTYIHGLFDRSFPPLENLVSSWICLRALDLHQLNIKVLPESISKLLHLRYLNLSHNNFKTLPNSITKLHNLQTLNLEGSSLEQLPWDIYKLVNLSSLNITDCRGMFSMPRGMDKLTCLHTLTAFEVSEVSTSEEECSSEDDSSSNREEAMGMLKDLKALTNLRGSISISIPVEYKDVNNNQILEGSGSGGYLGGMEHLKEVSVDFRGHEYGDELAINHEDLLEKLQPHPNLKGVQLWGYQGTSFTRWSSSLPNLVKIKIESAKGLQHLSLLSKLQYLKSLTLSSMSNLIYMDTMSSTSSSDYAQAPSEFTFFPSLEELSISYSPKLKGWWEGDQQLVAVDGSCWQPSFKRLFKLSILVCPKLESFPPCPRVKTLSLSDLDENFKIMESRDSNGNNNPRPSALKKVNLFENSGHLKSLPMTCVTSLSITWDHKVERLSQVKEAFKSCSSSLRRLTIRGCDNLMSVSQGLEYLTVLESLSIIECPVLTFSEEDDNNEDDAMPWRSLHQSLRSLELCKVESMTILPSGMQYLTALQDLNIECCWELKDLPEWIGCLSSLRSLRVRCCSEFQSLPETMQNLTSLKLLDLSYCKEGLKERCQNPNGGFREAEFMNFLLWESLEA
ncbi:Disease resistance protein RGA2 [Bienertia sinuspersici]